jgi:hypothetical protein
MYCSISFHAFSPRLRIDHLQEAPPPEGGKLRLEVSDTKRLVALVESILCEREAAKSNWICDRFEL